MSHAHASSREQQPYSYQADPRRPTPADSGPGLRQDAAGAAAVGEASGSAYAPRTDPHGAGRLTSSTMPDSESQFPNGLPSPRFQSGFEPGSLPRHAPQTTDTGVGRSSKTTSRASLAADVPDSQHRPVRPPGEAARLEDYYNVPRSPTIPQSRQFSSTLHHSTTSPPLSPISPTAPAAMAGSSAQMASGRNPSKDSAVSSVSNSSATHALNGSNSQETLTQEGKTVIDMDPATLIASAGSPEAAILKLLSEKKAMGTRSEQLWKLVEKQRTMVLGLHKDLERTIKEKDRYKRKLKEAIAASSGAGANGISRALEEEPLPSPGLPQSGSRDRSITSQQVVHPADPTAPIQRSNTGSIRELRSKAATNGTTEQMLMEMSGANVQHQRAGSGQLGSISNPSHLRNVSNPDSIQAASVSSNPTSQKHDHDLRLRMTGASASNIKQPPIASPGEKRKGPPTPLNLAQPTKSPIVAVAGHRAQTEQDEEDDDDDEEDEESYLAQFDRGRQKTREDDDRFREALAREVERKSRSAGKSKSKSKSKNTPPTEQAATVDQPPPPKVPAGGIPAASAAVAPVPTAQPSNDAPAGMHMGVGLPSSPRAPMLGGLQSPMQPSVGSISAMLGARPSNDMIPRQPDPSQALKSPGLPMSPRPSDRPVNAQITKVTNSALPGPGPLSPRAGAAGLPLSPRAPRQPLPAPSQNPPALMSPGLPKPEQMLRPLQGGSSLAPRSKSSNTRDLDNASGADDAANLDFIYKGLKSEQYPDFLLPPNALPSVDIKVASSRMRPSRHNNPPLKGEDEDATFTLAVYSRSENRQLWRVEKTILALPMLDSSLKQALPAPTAARLPDRSLFSGHSPAKVDARKAALNLYFEEILDTTMDEKSAAILCDFLSTDVIGPETKTLPPEARARASAAPTAVSEKFRRKEGYLAKRGKQFGGWKARYFVLDGIELKYYESPGGTHLGNIKLQKAQIAKQVGQVASSEEGEYRHAFIIFEPKRRDSSSLVRHVLCAENDDERDAWVDALLPCTEISEEEYAALGLNKERDGVVGKGANGLKAVGYDQTVAGNAPRAGRTDSAEATPTTPDGGIDSLLHTKSPSAGGNPGISGPVAGGPIQNAEAWGNRSPTLATAPKEGGRKRNLFGFKSRPSEDEAVPSRPGDGRSGSINRHARVEPPPKAVFGLPLAEAAELLPPTDIDICLPAPVYRCIEYLEAKNAAKEEGIFRLSGSSTVIKGLKERFNNEGDINLFDGQYYDVHAIASLLKLYLRELPESVLTRDMHIDFLKVLDVEDKKQKIAAINVLMHRLPEPNYELLATMSRFLIDIVNNADVNKMTVRNVGIVFAPTLNIPAPLISMLLTDYEAIFNAAVDPATSPVIQKFDESATTSTGAPSSDDLRSPRKQMFTDLPSAAPNQSTFGAQVHGIYRAPQQTSDGNSLGFVPMQTAPQRQFMSVQPPTFANPAMMQAQDSGFGSLNAAFASMAPPSGSSQNSNGPHPSVPTGRPTNSSTQQEPVARPRRESAVALAQALQGVDSVKRKGSLQKLKEMAGLRDGS